MELTPLTAIAPIDGRYHRLTRSLASYFSEFALMRFRLLVELEYLIALCGLQLPALPAITPEQEKALQDIYRKFTSDDAQRIKQMEQTTNHDVKAVEYFLRERLAALGLHALLPFVHFGLTSQDVNNTAIPLSFRDALQEVFLPKLAAVINRLRGMAQQWQDVPMLARTHGQPASPTLVGKEIQVFVTRLIQQKDELIRIPHAAKFGGATGNLNAHYAAFPNVNWHRFAFHFVNDVLGLKRSYPTTQIDHYDYLAAQCDALRRINIILIDLCRDMWMYISLNYFAQAVVAHEVGSSAMPHKVNPIDFENAEGNLGIANALLEHFSVKLPISRLQRDLTDSTVLRNLGVPMAHMLIALQALEKGLDKLRLNEPAIRHDLEQNWVVVAEAIQTILRREHVPDAYELLKDFTRGQAAPTQEQLHDFIDRLPVRDAVKAELKGITPFNYTGKTAT